LLLRPGEHPLAALRRALGSDAEEPIPDRLARIDPENRLVLVVDQFEETFVACRDEAERAAFVDALVDAAQGRDGRVLVVLAVRADYYGACAAYPRLARLLGASQVLVGPMRPDELGRAIEGPAHRAGLLVEPALVTRLVEDVAGRPNAKGELQEIVEFMRSRLPTQVITSHTVHHPELELTGPGEATGRWALNDVVIDQRFDLTIRGAAVYEDRYVKQDGTWRIAHTGYRRMYEELEPRKAPDDGGPTMTAHWWDTDGRSSLQA